MADRIGTSAADFIVAGNDADEIRGQDGNDTIFGGDGIDTLNGNLGSDLVIGRGGADRVYGGQSNDTVIAGNAGQIVNGNKGNDLVIGNGNSTVNGGAANDTIYGFAGPAFGDAGADLIYGGATLDGGNATAAVSGADFNFGEPNPDSSVPASNDTLVGSSGTNVFFGRAGNDQFIFQPQNIQTFNLTFPGNALTGSLTQVVTEGGYGGADVISDFEFGAGTGDIVALTSLDFGSTVTIAQSGSDTQIIVSGTTSGDGLGAVSTTNQNAGQTITLTGVNVLDFLATGSEDLQINGQTVNTSTPGLAVNTPNSNQSFTFTVGARQGRNINLANTGIIGTRLDATFSPAGVPLPSVNNDTIIGTDGDDTISGLAGNDTIGSDSGNDSVDGFTGDDTISGGSGSDPRTRIVTASEGTITVVTTDILLGGDGNDDIFGEGASPAPSAGNGNTTTGNNRDFIDGGAGNDDLFGEGDDDTIFGGAGNDLIDGGSGNDSVLAGAGDDTVDGGNFDNTNTSNGSGGDTIGGGAGNDSLNGDSGADSILGDAGNDTIEGESGADTLFGGEGSDEIDGGSGNDSIQGNAGPDTLIGGEDVDTLSYADFTTAVTAVLPELGATTTTSDNDVIAEFEAITGGSAGDIFTGNSLANTIIGNAGNDNISGLAGADTLFGNDGDDSISGGDGNDTIEGGNGEDSLTGNAGADTLVGGSNEDTLDGGADADSLVGGSGDDIYIIDNIGDVVSETDATGGTFDVVRIVAGGNFSTTNFANIERIEVATALPVTLPGALPNIPGFVVPTSNSVNITLAGPGPVSTFVGTPGSDVFVGTNSSDTFNALSGSDTVFSGNGNDNVNGESGNDLILTGTGADNVDGGSENDTIVTHVNFATSTIDFLLVDGNDVVEGDSGDDFISTGNGGDQIAGDAGNDVIIGGRGADQISLGSGVDTVVFAEAAFDGAALGVNPPGTFDVITDFVGGVDQIGFLGQFPTGVVNGSPVNPEFAFQELDDADNQSPNILNDVFRGNGSQLAGNQGYIQGFSADSSVDEVVGFVDLIPNINSPQGFDVAPFVGLNILNAEAVAAQIGQVTLNNSFTGNDLFFFITDGINTSAWYWEDNIEGNLGGSGLVGSDGTATVAPTTAVGTPATLANTAADAGFVNANELTLIANFTGWTYIAALEAGAGRLGNDLGFTTDTPIAFPALPVIPTIL